MSVVDTPDALQPCNLRRELLRHKIVSSEGVDIDLYKPNFARPPTLRRWHYRVRQNGGVLFHLVVGDRKSVV